MADNMCGRSGEMTGVSLAIIILSTTTARTVAFIRLASPMYALPRLAGASQAHQNQNKERNV